ncbi:MAG: DUF4190 domain-containing protein [Leucobacter sp.]
MSTTPPEYPQQVQPQPPQLPQQAQYNGTYPGTYTQQKPMPTKTTAADVNTYALVSIILTFLVPIAGIIFGHLGLSQIKRTGDAGRGLALTAVIYGYCVAALGAIFFITYIGLFVMLIGTAASAGTYY